METCDMEQQHNYSTETCKIKGNCGCELLKPVSALECHLCKVFLHSENNIEKHFSSLQHQTAYQIHLGSHIQHQGSVDANKSDVNEQNSGRRIPADNHNAGEDSNAGGNFIIGNLKNLVSSIGCEWKEGFPKTSNEDQHTTRIGLSGPVALADYSMFKSKNTNSAQKSVYDKRVSTANGAELRQNLNKHLSKNQSYPCKDLADVHDSLDIGTNDSLRGSDSNPRLDASVKRYNSMVEINSSDRIEGTHLKFEYNHGIHVSLNGKVLTTTVDSRETYQCDDIRAASIGNQEGAYKDCIIIKHEEHDDSCDEENDDENYDSDEDDDCGDEEDDDGDDYDDDGDDGDVEYGIIGRFAKNEMLLVCNKEMTPTATASSNTSTNAEERFIANEVTSDQQCQSVSSHADQQMNMGLIGNSTSEKQSKVSPFNGDINVNKYSYINMDVQKPNHAYWLGKEIDPKNVRDPENSLSHGIPTMAEYSKKNDTLADAGENPSFCEQQPARDTVNSSVSTSPYTCLLCGNHFKSSYNLEKHQTVHSTEKPFSCEVCGKCFKRREHVNDHQRIHGAEKAFACDICGKAFNRRSKLTEHSRTHTEEKPYSCSVCGKQFRWRQNVKAHQRIHTGEIPFSCEFCGKSFNFGSSLSKHKRIHSGHKPYLCDVCGEKFTTLDECKQHRTVHSVESSPSCNVCAKSFKCITNLKKHEKLHTIEEGYICEVCGTLFRTLGQLKVHRRIHTGVKPYSCDVCAKSFSQRGSLQEHEKVHTGERPFSCGICGIKFKTSSAHKNHERIHTAEKPYSCSICGKLFRQRGSIRRHERKHTDEKPYSCNVCPKLFKSTEDVKVHKKRMHSGETSVAEAVGEKSV